MNAQCSLRLNWEEEKKGTETAFHDENFPVFVFIVAVDSIVIYVS